MHRNILPPAVLAVMLGLAVTAETAAAQRPPRDTPAKPDFSDPFWAVPHLKQNRLDMSFCQYPDSAWQANLEGCCRMRVEVASDGAARVLDGQCTDNVFLLPSRMCLSPQSYWPAYKNGKAVKGTGEIVVNYVMPTDDPSLFEIMIAGMFGQKPRPKPLRPNDDICEKRPGDMISSLPEPRG